MSSISSIAAREAVSAAEASNLTVDVGFTTTVAGKKFDADVIYTGGQYVASDATISGAEATGVSLEDAEKNLINRIDTLV